MIAIDTNILVRFLVRDDKRQAETVRKRFKVAESNKERLWISLLVLQETIWVLESAYNRNRMDILDAVQALQQMTIFQFEAENSVTKLVMDGRTYKADLSDILIAHCAENSGSESGLTFDKTAAKLPFFKILT